ncbi:MAG: hypothetical protein SFT92_01725 [Rickettsiales bacterium]|nr:hypothetical protein [Rickettsiales bacterium]
MKHIPDGYENTEDEWNQQPVPRHLKPQERRLLIAAAAGGDYETLMQEMVTINADHGLRRGLIDAMIEHDQLPTLKACVDEMHMEVDTLMAMQMAVKHSKPEIMAYLIDQYDDAHKAQTSGHSTHVLELKKLMEMAVAADISHLEEILNIVIPHFQKTCKDLSFTHEEVALVLDNALDEAINTAIDSGAKNRLRLLLGIKARHLDPEHNYTELEQLLHHAQIKNGRTLGEPMLFDLMRGAECLAQLRKHAVITLLHMPAEKDIDAELEKHLLAWQEEHASAEAQQLPFLAHIDRLKRQANPANPFESLELLKDEQDRLRQFMIRLRDRNKQPAFADRVEAVSALLKPLAEIIFGADRAPDDIIRDR